MTQEQNFKRYFALVCVSVGSKLIFMIPYVMTTYYIVFQNATGFTNSQIGLLMTVLGTCAVLMYLPGGFIADRIPIRAAVPIGLIGGGLLGILIAITVPSFPVMLCLYAMFPIFIAGFMWSSAMKAIRMLGKDEEAGKNQTIRTISISVVSLSIAGMAIGYLSISSDDLMAYRMLMTCYSTVIIMCGLGFFFTFKPVVEDTSRSNPLKLRDFLEVLRIKQVILIGVFGSVVYITAISLVYIQPYMTLVFGLSSAASSALGVICKDLSLISTPFIVWLAARRKTSHTKIMTLGLVICLMCFIMLLVMPKSHTMLIPSIVVFLVAGFWTMGAWILQFIPVNEIKLPIRVTGSAIGFISMIVHLGDTFFYALCGMWIDKYGLTGYQYIFIFTIAILIIAIATAFSVSRYIDRINLAKIQVDSVGETALSSEFSCHQV